MKYLLLAVGGYVLYEYFYGTGTAAGTTVIPPTSAGTTQPGATGGTTVTTPVVNPTSTPAQPQVSSNLQTQLTQLANAFVTANGAVGLNIYQWMYYYKQITGTDLNGTAKGEQMIQFCGLNDNTANTTIINLGTFISALGNAGLNGLGFLGGLGLVRGTI